MSELDEIREFRRELHRFPELSGREDVTASRVIKMIHPLRPDELHVEIGENGLIATFSGVEPGPELLFRAELDALPIEEENTFKHRSCKPGISHKCGHDGHMAILVGLAYMLRDKPIKKGKVHLLFQPAEEIGAGASAMLNDPKFPKIKPDFAFALHNLPGYPMHQVLCKSGSFTPAVRSLIVKLYGKTAHAAEPENGINPSMGIAKMLNLTYSLNQPDPASSDFFLLTPVHIHVGEKAYGVSAGYGEVHFTIRCWTNKGMEQKSEELLEALRVIAEKEKLKMETKWTNNFSANENDEKAVEIIQEAAVRCGFDFQHLETPLKWGEDFGYFTQRFPGAMFGLGAGLKTPALHSPDYDFPDELIASGILMFDRIIDSQLR